MNPLKFTPHSSILKYLCILPPEYLDNCWDYGIAIKKDTHLKSRCLSVSILKQAQNYIVCATGWATAGLPGSPHATYPRTIKLTKGIIIVHPSHWLNPLLSNTFMRTYKT